MARKQTAKTAARNKAPEYLSHVCGDCDFGVPYYDGHLDMHGNPVLLGCPFHKWKRVRSEKACDKWKAKKQKNEQNAK